MNTNSKPYSQMTEAERRADRIAKNRMIEANVAAEVKIAARAKSAKASRKATKSLAHDLALLISTAPKADQMALVQELRALKPLVTFRRNFGMFN